MRDVAFMSIVPKQDGLKTKTAFMAKRLRRQQVKNYEMFERIFGFHPEEYSIVPCPDIGRCKYTDRVNQRICHCTDWWQEEYTGYFQNHNGQMQEPAIQIHAAWCQECSSTAGGNTVIEWRCSNCGAEFEAEELDWKFCPRCGAKMDKGAAGE